VAEQPLGEVQAVCIHGVAMQQVQGACHGRQQACSRYREWLSSAVVCCGRPGGLYDVCCGGAV
jgi:hypothetical protein